VSNISSVLSLQIPTLETPRKLMGHAKQSPTNIPSFFHATGWVPLGKMIVLKFMNY